MTEFKYAGSELDLFRAVHNWKSYWSRQIQPFITGDVLEVGAGMGANTPFLDTGPTGRWVCLEPDAQLIAQLDESLAHLGTAHRYERLLGTIQSLDPGETFNTVIYIDVLEHIEKDREELKHAASRLRPGGRIIVLAPAHQWLFTPFDAAIGHFRRYNRPMLRSLSPPGLEMEKLFYLDSAGLLLSTANRVLLHQSMPTEAQLRFWDKWIIPISRVLDTCLLYAVGKSIIGIWHREKAR